MTEIKIANRIIGEGHPPFVIAEAGANANSDLKLALRLVDGAADAGTDAIKFQHYQAGRLVTKTAPKYYVDTMAQWLAGAAPDGCQYDEFSQLDGLSFADWRTIKERCDQRGIAFLSTPFDFEAIGLLEQLGVPAHKIASADITYHQFIKAVAEKGKPVILSTGASTMAEVEAAVEVIESTGNRQIILLQCTLHYPCHPHEVNLNAMRTMRERFPNYPIGLSDHSLGIHIPIIAGAVGAAVIEKHYTVDKSLPTSTDHFMSVDPAELREMCGILHQLPAIFGSPDKKPVAAEELAVQYARRSLTTSRDIAAGELLTRENTSFKRPGTGIQPNHAASDVLGKKRTVRDISADTTITFGDIAR